MKPEIDQKVRVIHNSNNHSYQVGRVYRVKVLDTNDQTARLVDGKGQVRDWCSWDDLVAVDVIGWQFLQKQLPAEVVDLLSCFDGLEALRLRDEVCWKILLAMPDLKGEILRVAAEDPFAECLDSKEGQKEERERRRRPSLP